MREVDVSTQGGWSTSVNRMSFTAPSQGSVEVLSLRPQPLPRPAASPPPSIPGQTPITARRSYRLGPLGRHDHGARRRARRRS